MTTISKSMIAIYKDKFNNCDQFSDPPFSNDVHGNSINLYVYIKYQLSRKST